MTPGDLVFLDRRDYQTPRTPYTINIPTLARAAGARITVEAVPGAENAIQVTCLKPAKPCTRPLRPRVAPLRVFRWEQTDFLKKLGIPIGSSIARARIAP
jgi:hypothetical protein